MAKTKKKSGTTAKKQVKSATKKTLRAKPKKKSASAARKPAANPGRKKISASTTRKKATKKISRIRKPKMETAEQEIQIPEAVKPNEQGVSTPPGTESNPENMNRNKISEHQFEHRSEVIMNQENQRVKAAMANRQDTKRVFHTERHK